MTTPQTVPHQDTYDMPAPPCPFCGERQAQSEAVPSKPILAPRVGNAPRETYYNDHCRSCGKRIVFGFTRGDGSLAQLATGKARYHWSKP